MADDSTDTGSQDLGESLVRRAAAPGLIGHDIAARIQRRSRSGGDSLAAEIQRRWSPAGSSGAWDAGPGLVHPAGFGAAGGAAGGSMGGLVQAMPVARAVSTPGGPVPGPAGGPVQAMPVARTVSQVAAGPAAQALPDTGSSLQRSSLGAGGGGFGSGGGEMVQRSVAASLPSRPLTPGPSPIPSLPPGEGRQEPLVQRVSAPPSLPSGAEMGPAIVRRAAGSPWAGGLATGSPLPSAMPLRRAAEPVAGAAVEMGPAIVHRAAGRGPVQRASLAPGGAGLPLPLAQPAQAPQAEAVAPVQRASVSPISPIGQISPIGPMSPTAPASPGAAALPLVQARRAAVASPAPAPSAAAGLAMPLARSVAPGGRGDHAPGGVLIQRQPAESFFGAPDRAAAATETPGGTAAAATPDSSSAGGAAAAGETGTAAAGFDLEDVVESVMRRLTRSLAVENERHGGRRWP